MASNDFRIIRGNIIYLHDNEGEIGRESFIISSDQDGFRTLRATCEIESDKLLRDVIYTVNKDWLPIDAFVRLSINGSFQGSSWFNFSEHVIECEAITKDAGRISQKQYVDSWPKAFGAHPVSNDAWGCAVYDISSQNEVQKFKNCVTTSKTPHGSTGPTITLTEKYLSYHGEEEITVPAGTFTTKYFQISWDKDKVGYDWPPIHVWVHSDDFIMVKIRWDHLDSSYILDQLIMD